MAAAIWLFNGNVQERGQSLGRKDLRDAIYLGTAHREAELCAEPLPPRHHRRQALPAAGVSTGAQALERPSGAQCCSSAPLTPGVDGSCRTSPHSTNKQPAPRSLAAPRQIASRPPPASRSGSAKTVDSKKSTARNVSASTSEPSHLVATELTATKAPRQRSAVNLPTAGKRRGVSSGNSSSTRRQHPVSSASRFYAEVVNRQAALGSKSVQTLARELRLDIGRSSSY